MAVIVSKPPILLTTFRKGAGDVSNNNSLFMSQVTILN